MIWTPIEHDINFWPNAQTAVGLYTLDYTAQRWHVERLVNNANHLTHHLLSSQRPKRHLDRFSRFCVARGRAVIRQKEPDHATARVRAAISNRLHVDSAAMLPIKKNKRV